MPAAILEIIRNTQPESVQVGGMNPSQIVLDLASNMVLNFDLSANRGDDDPLVIFRVVNPYPEKRTLVQVPHLWTLRSTIVATTCLCVSKAGGSHWIVQEQVADQVSQAKLNSIFQNKSNIIAFLF